MSLSGFAASPQPRPARLLILDRHELFRRGLVIVLAPERDITVVGESGDLAEAVALVHAVKPDVVLVDVQVAEGAAAACAEIRRAGRDVAVLLLTADPRDAARQAAEAGAAGWLLKETSMEEVATAVRAAVDGQATAGRPSPPDAG